VVEERFPDMIVKHFGCTVVHIKALYKCLIHSLVSISPYTWGMTDFHRVCGKLGTVSGGWKAELLVVAAPYC